MTCSNFEKIKRKKQTYRKQTNRRVERTEWYQVLVGFTCGHCGAPVSSDVVLSGVNNRNHCPYCLWSKHVDLYQSGDRLNVCKAHMRPIGLTFKQERNKYGSGLGELQVIHQCSGCGGLSINRIAADDDNDLLWSLYEDGLQFNLGLEKNIRPARREDKELVYRRLFG
jgi:DNA-directed RNA polymerase subunit RPC12/RpoP